MVETSYLSKKRKRKSLNGHYKKIERRKGVGFHELVG